MFFLCQGEISGFIEHCVIAFVLFYFELRLESSKRAIKLCLNRSPILPKWPLSGQRSCDNWQQALLLPRVGVPRRPFGGKPQRPC